MAEDDVSYAVRCMKKRLRRIGLDLTAAHRSRGRILVVNPMPKWQPVIPPAATLEGGAT